jgi:hypothetical protein
VEWHDHVHVHGVHVSPAFQQQPHGSTLPCAGGLVEGGATLVVYAVDWCTGLEQGLRCSQMALACCQVQGHSAIVQASLHFCPLGNQQLHHIGTVTLCRCM